MQEKIFKAIFIVLFAILGIVLSVQSETILIELLPHSVISESFLGVTLISIVLIISGVVIGAAVGFALSPHLTRWLFALITGMESSLSQLSTWDLLLGTLGLFLGLVVANLIGMAFDQVPVVGPYVSVVLSIVLGYLGLHLCLGKKNEMLVFVQSHQDNLKKKDKKEKEKEKGKLLDTNIIIDGRIVDIYKSGFLEGPIIVPVFVLEELQKIADSSDSIKRNRGRRGLDILNQLRHADKDAIRIVTDDYEDTEEVDSKLVRLALDKDWRIITNDFNLNQVAELQGITVMNLNDLAKAMKPPVIPGEQLFVQLIKQGKEDNQGVAYLDDGTMIVVANGSHAIGHEVPVIITSVYQTAAGRMIFAKLEEFENE
jgi:uncharacterized protein YacL